MGDLYLNPGESIVLTANKVQVNFVPFDVILTTSRLIFVDSTYARFDPQMIPLEDIFSVRGGEIATGEPTITLTIAPAESPEQTESTELLFSQEHGERRTPESREWLRKIMEAIVAVRQKSTVTDSHTAEAETGMRPSIRRWIAPEILAPHKVVTDPHPPASAPDAVPGPTEVALALLSQSPEENLPESEKSPEVTDTESPIADETHSHSEEKIQEREGEEIPSSTFMEVPIEAAQPGRENAHAEDEPIRPVPVDSPETTTTPEEEQSTIPDRSRDLPVPPEKRGSDDTPDQNPATTPASSEREIIGDTGIGKEPDEPVSEPPSQDLPEELCSVPNREAGDLQNSPPAITWPTIPVPVTERAATPGSTSSDDPEIVSHREEGIGSEGHISETAARFIENDGISRISRPSDEETDTETEIPKTPLEITRPIIPATAIEFAAAPVPINLDETPMVAHRQEEKIPGEGGSEIAPQTEENREIPGVSLVSEEGETSSVTDSPEAEKIPEEFSRPEEAKTGERVPEKPGGDSGRENRETIPETPVAPGTDPVTESTDQPGSSDEQEIPSGGATIQSGDSGKPASEEVPVTKIPEEITISPPQRDSSPRIKMTAAIVVIAVILIALAGVALVASTTYNGNTTPVTTPVPTPSPTITATPTPVTIPGTGVWVRVIYNHHYYGQLGNSGDFREISDTGDKFYVIRNEGNLVQVRVEKQDNTGDPLTVEIYRKGAVITSESIRTPMGEISLLIDPATGKPPVVVTPKQQ